MFQRFCLVGENVLFVPPAKVDARPRPSTHHWHPDVAYQRRYANNLNAENFGLHDPMSVDERQQIAIASLICYF